MAEFELDFRQKERELEKEKLDLERRLIQEREHEIALETQDYKRRRRVDEDEDDDDLDDSELDESSNDEDDETDYYANSSEEELINAEEAQARMLGGPADGMTDDMDDEAYGDEEADFYDAPQNADPGVFEIEWDMVPQDPEPDPAQGKRDRKSKKSREDRKSKRKNRDNQETHKSSRRHRHGDRTERASRRHKNRRNQDGKPSHRHRHRRQQNDIPTTGSEPTANGFEFHYYANDDQPNSTPVISQGNQANASAEPANGPLSFQTFNVQQPRLPTITVPHVPVARIPVPPPHPLGHAYSRFEDPTALEQLLMQASLPNYYPQQPLHQIHGYEAHLAPDEDLYRESAQTLLAREPFGPQFHELPHPTGHLYRAGTFDTLDHYKDQDSHISAEKKELEMSLFGPHAHAEAHDLLQHHPDLDHSDFYYGASHQAPYYAEAHARALFGGHFAHDPYPSYDAGLFANDATEYQYVDPNGEVRRLASLAEHAGADPALYTEEDYMRMLLAHAYDENRNKSNKEQD